MKILVNATTLVVGGGIQVGVSFIQVAIKEKRFEWKFLVSKGIFDSLLPDIRNKHHVICIPVSPAKIILGKKSKIKILRICKDWKPDIIYSIGFPSYIHFKQLEIGRYTNGWEINKKPLPWKLYPKISDRIKIWLAILYRQIWARRATYIETQTEAAKKGIVERVRFPTDRIKVIPNSPNKIFIDAGKANKKFLQNEVHQIFCLASPHPNKNLTFIPDVAFELKRKFGLRPNFLLTIPEDNKVLASVKRKAITLGVVDQIHNIGKIKLEDCLNYYKKADLVFLPTLLEIFSATYLEAMAMKVPIVTSDLDFARDNCGDAAHFFEADNINDAAEKIYDVITNDALKQALIEKGEFKLNSYPNNHEKYKALFDWFEEIIKKQ